MRYGFVGFPVLLLSLAAALPAADDAPAPRQLQELGSPLSGVVTLPASGVTGAGAARRIWFAVRQPERRGVLGVDPSTGRSRYLDYAGESPKMMACRTWNGKVYTLLGPASTGTVVEYDPAGGAGRTFRLPVDNRYFLNVAVDVTATGRLVAGFYPEAEIGWVDLRTGETGGSGRLSPNPMQKYVIDLYAGAGDTVFFSTGEDRPEVYFYDLARKSGRQLVSAEQQRQGGRARLNRGADGGIYLELQGRFFRCRPDRLEPVERPPKLSRHGGELALPDGGGRVVGLDPEAVLVLRDGKEIRRIKTDFEPTHPLIYSISGGLGETVWVGGFGPAVLASFRHGAETPIRFRQYGRPGRADTQVYSCGELPEKLYIASYMKARLEVMDKTTGKVTSVVSLGDTDEQDRIFSLVAATDGKFYGATMPTMSRYGGGILEVDPAGDRWRFDRNVIPDQSIRDLAALPDGTLFGVSDTDGGTGSPEKKGEAVCFVWDPAARGVRWKLAPIPGERRYLGAHRISGTRVWTVGRFSGRIVVLDTAERRVVREFPLPGEGSFRPVGSVPALGDAAWILRGDALYRVDLESGRTETILRSPAIRAKFSGALHDTRAEYLAPDGTLYFGSGSKLYRLSLRKL